MEDFEKTRTILEEDGYFESASPWMIPEVAIQLRRFLKGAGEEDEMLIDILVATNETVKAIIRNAVAAQSAEGTVMVADRHDLIWLKRTRDSKQDQADIDKLEYDKDR